MTHRSGRDPKPFIATTLGQPYLAKAMIRLFTCLLAALGLFFSPIVMAGGGGMAAAHSTAATAMPDAHCGGEEAPADDRQPDFEASCMSSCAAFTPDHGRLIEEVTVARMPIALPRPELPLGIHPEGETPPPRNTP